MYYYEVAIGVERHWKSAIFTYCHESKISIGTLVRVSFGRQKKTGMVYREVKKPEFVAKNIVLIHELSIDKATQDFMKWYKNYYQAESGQVYAQFIPNYLTVKQQQIAKPTSIINLVLPALTPEQVRAMQEVNSTQRPSVLHGITGAGKTRVYINLLHEQLKIGKNALLLYPEISLTSQVISELEKYLPVICFHSQLTNAQRSKLWYTVANNSSPLVIVGPRSSLFLPHKNLGIIIIDEFHEQSYKQENDIRYNSVYAAAGAALSHKAKLLLGSATPSVTETYQVINRGGNLVCIHEKAIKANLTKKFTVIDAKDRKQFTIHPMISNKLIQSIGDSLKKKQQTMLFINRRGTAKLVLCSSDTCDWQAECTNCDLPLTYHHDKHRLHCHTCGKIEPITTACPKCSSQTDLKSLGSKAIVDDIAKLFPGAKIGRFDSDTNNQDSMQANYTDIRSGSIDILIGTQQIVKGLDLPRLSTIGILNADLSLNFPDFSSDERTFQLITQAMGRVGRGHTEGVIILQTFQPNNPIIQNACSEDWHTFMKLELNNRKKHNFPPYLFYAKLVFRQKTLEKAEKKAAKCKELLKINNTILIDGPLPSFFLKRGGYYYIQLLLSSKSRHYLTEAVSAVPKDTIIDLDPSTLL